MSYTKGDWYWEYNDQMHHNLRAKGTHLSGCVEDKHILFVAPDFLGEDSLINEDDANLIAASKDMYEALKFLVTGKREDGKYDRYDAAGFIKIAEDALAKAEGGE